MPEQPADIAAVFDEHVRCEFVTCDVDATMRPRRAVARDDSRQHRTIAVDPRRPRPHGARTAAAPQSDDLIGQRAAATVRAAAPPATHAPMAWLVLSRDVGLHPPIAPAIESQDIRGTES